MLALKDMDFSQQDDTVYDIVVKRIPVQISEESEKKKKREPSGEKCCHM